MVKRSSRPLGSPAPIACDVADDTAERWVPAARHAVTMPAPVERLADQKPGWHAQAGGQMSEGAVDGDDQVKIDVFGGGQ